MTQWGLDVLFNPSKRHLDEEKRRLQATRPVVGDNSGGKRIDLESGKVRISGKKAPDTDQPSADEESNAPEPNVAESVESMTIEPPPTTRRPTEADAPDGDDERGE